MEEARVSLKGHREAVWTDIQSQEKDGLISEDVKFKAKEDMQKIIDEGNKALEEIFKKKELEITTQ
jgi:ribosome recycling factor